MRVNLFAIIFLLLGCQLFAKYTSGQDARDILVTMELKDVSLITAFKKIEEKTNFLFAYQPSLIAAQDNISLPKATRSVSATLKALLEKTGLGFRQSGTSIIIVKAEKNIPAVFTPADAKSQVLDTAISGIVQNENGQPLENVSVRLQNSTTGTATDPSGRFRLSLGNLSGVLIFSSVGYEQQQVKVDSRQTYSISLKLMNRNMDEVIVIGYGTKKKIDLTGTVNSLQADEIVKARASNTQEAMQGRLPGVDIRRTSGKPGSDFTIEIRGANSITGSTQPLYVIDGIAVAQLGGATNPVNDINPADIERIDVLKDASSTAIYGSRGANGVILITTKRGTAGSSKISYDGYAGIVNPTHVPPVMDGPTFVAYAKRLLQCPGRISCNTHCQLGDILCNRTQ